MSNPVNRDDTEPFRAFPSSAVNPYFGGMTLRDWFAGQALVGLLAHASSQGARVAPAIAWVIADEMLAERERGGDKP